MRYQGNEVQNGVNNRLLCVEKLRGLYSCLCVGELASMRLGFLGKQPQKLITRFPRGGEVGRQGVGSGGNLLFIGQHLHLFDGNMGRCYLV